MLRKQLTKLPITCSLSITKSPKRVTFCVTSTSYSNFLQLPRQQKKSIDDNDIEMMKLKRRTDGTPAVFYEHLTNVAPQFREKVLENYDTLSMHNADPYLISRVVGDKFVALIKDDLLKSMSHVIELNPGFGILTESLLQAGVPFITLFEKYNDFYSCLKNLDKVYPGQLDIKKANLFAMPKMLNLNYTQNPDRKICEFLDYIPKKEWDDETCMQIIGATSKYIFIRHLILSIIFQSGFMMYGRPTFYLAITPSVWNKFMYNGKQSSTNSVMFNTLLDYKIYGTIDRNGFIPWLRRRKATCKKRKNDSEMFFVVKLVPKSDLLKLFGGRNDLIYYWHFVRHYFYKPSLRVIPALEKIIPDCGVRLIENNYNIFTEFGHLNPSQARDLFLQFKSWPEFKESSFLLGANEIKKTFDPFTEESE